MQENRSDAGILRWCLWGEDTSYSQERKIQAPKGARANSGVAATLTSHGNLLMARDGAEWLEKPAQAVGRAKIRPAISEKIPMDSCPSTAQGLDLFTTVL